MFAIEQNNTHLSPTIMKTSLENQMLDYSIMKKDGILVLKPQAPLCKEDFSGLSLVVDAYLSEHMHFVHEHHNQVERVAIVTDSTIGNIVESLGKHFTSAEIRHFHFNEYIKAWVWLTTMGFKKNSEGILTHAI